jgi:uncharacterized protein YyaL (SSP411 family)
MHAYTDESGYRERAERTLQLLSAVAGQYGVFAATYGIALTHLLSPQTHIVIVGEDELAAELLDQSTSVAPFGTSILRLNFNQAVSENLPPALAQTIPALPFLKESRSAAVVCCGGSCKPPAYKVEDLAERLTIRRPAA